MCEIIFVKLILGAGNKFVGIMNVPWWRQDWDHGPHHQFDLELRHPHFLSFMPMSCSRGFIVLKVRTTEINIYIYNSINLFMLLDPLYS